VTYNEPCPPVTGTAAGNVTLFNAAGTVAYTTEFISWTRVGVDAAILISDTAGGAADGAGTAVFDAVPTPAELIPPCAPGVLNATVIGSATWT
jgi:hypothetical protein